jgi:2-oxoisovalerate dehydrogenase E2 component (dihydrolipoyl transacylase)
VGQYVFKLPDVGEGTAEAEIVAWHVRVGDVVKEDAPLVDVMTDKATVEMTSSCRQNRLAQRQAGDMAPVGGRSWCLKCG